MDEGLINPFIPNILGTNPEVFTWTWANQKPRRPHYRCWLGFFQLVGMIIQLDFGSILTLRSPHQISALHKLPFFQVFAQSVLLGCGGWMNGVISDKNKNLDGFKMVTGKKVPDVSIPENQKSVITKQFPCPRNRVHAESPGFELEVLEDYLLLRVILNVRSEVYEFYIVLCSGQTCNSWLFIHFKRTNMWVFYEIVLPPECCKPLVKNNDRRGTQLAKLWSGEAGIQWRCHW